MPTFREIDEPDDDDIEDIENPFRIRRITIEERDAILGKLKEKFMTSEEASEFVKKHNIEQSLKIAKTETRREFKVEKNEVSNETEFERIKKRIQEYGGTTEEFEKLMDELIEPIDEKQSDIITDTSTSDLEKTHLKDCGTIQERSIKMWIPHIRGIHIESEKQFMKIIRDDFPGVEKHTNFHKYFQQIGFHIKTVNEFSHRKTVTYHELGKFARNINGSSSTIEAWVLQGAKPSIYVLLNEHALSKDEGLALVSGIKEKLKGLDSLEKMNQHLEHPHHKKNTTTIPSFLKDYENACGFYRFLEEIVEGGIINDVASHVGISGNKAREYTRDHRLPRLIRKVLSTALENTSDFQEIEHLPSEEEFETSLERHPHLKEIEDFDIMTYEVLAYIRLKTMQREGNLPDATQEELSKIFNIPSARLNLYLSGKSSPRLFQMLGVHERARLEHEKKLGTPALGHRIDPTLVFENLKQFKKIQDIPIIELVSAIRVIYENTRLSPKKIQFIDLQHYTPTGQDWFKGIVKTCAKQRWKIEEALNQQLGLGDDTAQRFRLGVISSRIYFRLEDTRETNLLSLYGNEMFHFHDQKRFYELLSRAKKQLGIKGDISLSRLAHQITDYDKSLTVRGMNTDLHYLSSYIKGSTLSLLLDSCDISIQEIESDISFIGRIDRHGIHNPKFSTNPLDINKTFARIFGAGLSDGHIDQFRVFCYCDTSKERIEILKKYFEFFGNVDYTETCKDGIFELRYPSVIGRALELRGFPVGDKTVQNRGLPKFIIDGTIECIIEYVKQLWVEDGHFTWYKDRAWFGWTRAVSLLDPEKDNQYNRESEITGALIEFIHDEGTYHECLCGRIHPHYQILGGQLNRLKESGDIKKARIANILLDIIQRNKPQLLIDEQRGIEKLGVTSKSACTEVTHYLGTGRVSALWRARTQGADDAMRIAILTPPDDVRKKRKVMSWIESESEKYAQISYELQRKGWVI